MKKFFIILALFTGMIFSVSANAQSMQDFSMTNNTGMILIDVYISPDNQDSWGSDVIPKDLILDGETFNFTFGVDESHCVWDIMFTAEDGNKYYMQDVNLCNTVSITLTRQ
jgi:hypothetical protein